MIDIYREMPKDADEHHDTYIIAFCPDTDSFFITDTRCYFWDTEGALEFNSVDEAVKYFEDHLEYFLDVNNTLMEGMFYGITFKDNKKVVLEMTDNKTIVYEVED